MNEVLKAEQLSKSYISGASFQSVLRHVNLTIYEGEQVAIIGSSGGGKSTLLSILGCLDIPDRGNYFVHGEKVAWKSSSQLAKLRGSTLATIFQGFELVSHWTVLENVILGLRYKNKPKNEQRELAFASLKRVGLQNDINKFPSELSGGEQQRVAIARALCANPKVLLADEPTGNLDPKTAQSIMDLFQKLNEDGHTIVMVTHDLSIAEKSHRILEIQAGRLTS
jgi:putative ABC transport system ATP-binding protein